GRRVGIGVGDDVETAGGALAVELDGEGVRALSEAVDDPVVGGDRTVRAQEELEGELARVRHRGDGEVDVGHPGCDGEPATPAAGLDLRRWHGDPDVLDGDRDHAGHRLVPVGAGAEGSTPDL